jgi:hypothetical protein
MGKQTFQKENQPYLLIYKTLTEEHSKNHKPY